jgi:hypothetical protein
MGFALAGDAWFVLHYFGALPCLIVFGQVLDELRNPVENARVTARLAVSEDLDEDKTVKTDTTGNFLVIVGRPAWSYKDRGLPGISVRKPGYRAYWKGYERWTWGPKLSRITIMLQKNDHRVRENVYTPLMEASKMGDTAGVRLLLEEGAGVSDKDSHGMTALMEASKAGHLEVVKLLLEKGAEVNERNSNGMTALKEAFMGGHLEVIKLLLEKGAHL